jgi:uncharacterized protein
MIPRLRRWLLWLCLCAPLAAAGASPAEGIPAQTALLVDQTGLLQPEEREALLRRLGEIQASGRAQVAILLAADTQGQALADYAIRVAQAWKLGHAGRDDGLLVVVLPGSTAARIEVGYGLEGNIPDLRASQWIDELLPTIKNGQLAEGLHHLLDEVEAALPAAAIPKSEENILDRHPEWKLPFVLAIFSPFALFPLFLGRWGALASAPLFAAFLGMAAWMLWSSRPAAFAIAGAALALPPLWSLNASDSQRLPGWLQWAKHAGNLAAVLIFFAVITMFVGVGLSGQVEQTWAAPVFAGTLALGLAVFLFPGKPARVLLVVLRSVMHFLFILVVAWLALHEFVAEPGPLAFWTAGVCTALIALALYLDRREVQRMAAGENVTRWSHWLVGLSVLLALPFVVVLFVQSFLGGEAHTRIAQAAAGGGSVGALAWWLVRSGFVAAVSLGLGGRFGGGGAEGRE